MKKSKTDTELATRGDPYPLHTFCRLCRELGYEIYPMDVIAASEETYTGMNAMEY